MHHGSEKLSGKTGETAYIVKKGDTLYSIGKKYGVDFKTLAKMNGIRRPYSIFVGQRIYVAGKKEVVAKIAQSSRPKATSTRKKVNQSYAAKRYPPANHGKVKLSWPTEGKVSSKFGPRKNRMHDGIDISAKEGATVVAAAAGKVVYADSKLAGYGNLIIIRHSTDMFTAYAHNQKNLVSRGQQVVSGQRIALVGSSGRSSVPHLHFEVRRGETAVDPLAYLPRR